MPVTENPLTSGSDTTDATSFTTASFTLTANRLGLLAVAYSGTITIPTVTNWTEVTNRANGTLNRRVILFRRLVASDATGTATIDFGASTATGCAWSVAEFISVDTSGTNGSGAIVQSPTATGTSTTRSVTLAAFGSVDNATYSCHQAAENIAQTETDFSEIHDLGYATPNLRLQSQWKNSNDTVADCGGGNVAWSMIGVEIKFAAAAGPGVVFRRTLSPVGTRTGSRQMHGGP